MGGPLFTFNKRVHNLVKFVEGSLYCMESTGGQWNDMGSGTVEEQRRNCLVFPWRRYEASSCDLGRRHRSEGLGQEVNWTCRVRRP